MRSRTFTEHDIGKQQDRDWCYKEMRCFLGFPKTILLEIVRKLIQETCILSVQFNNFDTFESK